jgi:histidine ammonia-lyase
MTDTRPVSLDGHQLSLADLESVARDGRGVAIAASAWEALHRSRQVVDRLLERGSVVYGVNTGFGNFAETVIPADKLRDLQRNLVRSHAAGVGDPLDVPETRALMTLRANALAQGLSGVRAATLERLVLFLNEGVHPLVPSQGSVGASGDLAPSAHVALAMIGEGSCRYRDRVRPAAEVLRDLGQAPLTLEAKEGLALINGTPLLTGVAAMALAEAQRLVRAADIAGAMSLDALQGTDVAFDPRIQQARGHLGQCASARNLVRLLAGSPLRESHRGCGRVQDAYSLRCMPQVHGAARDALGYVTATVGIEMNAATDNPLVFADDGVILSGGNFHGEPVALAADVLTMAVAELGAISERRTERMVNPVLSGLPAFLTPHGGLESGLMLAQVTAAALASENKTLAHPASVDSIPTSADREDHVSMGPIASRKAARAVANVRRILAIEILAACDAFDLHRPLVSSPALMAVHAHVRRFVPAREGDRPPGPDIELVAQEVRSGAVVTAAQGACGALE